MLGESVQSVKRKGIVCRRRCWIYSSKASWGEGSGRLGYGSFQRAGAES